MEYCAGGHLEDYISPRRPMSVAAARYYFSQLMDGVVYCHGKVSQFIHAYVCVCIMCVAAARYYFSQLKDSVVYCHGKVSQYLMHTYIHMSVAAA